MSHGTSTLTGVRVVSLAINLPGPLAAARLAARGAAVTKVEPPSGDPLAVVAPRWYEQLGAGQEIRTIDLKTAAGLTALESLLGSADVLLTAMRPSALDRLGIEECARRHGLALVEIFGYDAERAEEAGHDLTYQAARGTLIPPALPAVPLVDLLGAERAVTATLLALRRRHLGEPSPRERVILDDAARDAADAVRHGLTGPGGPLGGSLPTYNIYPTADGHVAVAALEPHFARRLATVIGRTHDELSARFAEESSSHWQQVGAREDIPIVAVDGPRAVPATRTGPRRHP